MSTVARHDDNLLAEGAGKIRIAPQAAGRSGKQEGRGLFRVPYMRTGGGMQIYQQTWNLNILQIDRFFGDRIILYKPKIILYWQLL